MLKNIRSALSKFFTMERVLIVVVIIVLIIGLGYYTDAKKMVRDAMETGNAEPKKEEKKEMQGAHVAAAPAPAPVEGYKQQAVAAPSDLLPSDENSKFAELNPNAANADSVMTPDLLQAGYHIGLDTVGQTLRNANLQLRSDPVISKKDIGPWMNSTIEPDMARTPLELGER